MDWNSLQRQLQIALQQQRLMSSFAVLVVLFLLQTLSSSSLPILTTPESYFSLTFQQQSPRGATGTVYLTGVTNISISVRMHPASRVSGVWLRRPSLPIGFSPLFPDLPSLLPLMEDLSQRDAALDTSVYMYSLWADPTSNSSVPVLASTWTDAQLQMNFQSSRLRVVWTRGLPGQPRPSFPNDIQVSQVAYRITATTELHIEQSTDQLTWDNAKLACEAKGLRLAYYVTADQLQAVHQFIANAVTTDTSLALWTGILSINDGVTDGPFCWVTAPDYPGTCAATSPWTLTDTRCTTCLSSVVASGPYAVCPLTCDEFGPRSARFINGPWTAPDRALSLNAQFYYLCVWFSSRYDDPTTEYIGRMVATMEPKLNRTVSDSLSSTTSSSRGSMSGTSTVTSRGTRSRSSSSTMLPTRTSSLTASMDRNSASESHARSQTATHATTATSSASRSKMSPLTETLSTSVDPTPTVNISTATASLIRSRSRSDMLSRSLSVFPSNHTASGPRPSMSPSRNRHISASSSGDRSSTPSLTVAVSISRTIDVLPPVPMLVQQVTDAVGSVGFVAAATGGGSAFSLQRLTSVLAVIKCNGYIPIPSQLSNPFDFVWCEDLLQTSDRNDTTTAAGDVVCVTGQKGGMVGENFRSRTWMAAFWRGTWVITGGMELLILCLMILFVVLYDVVREWALHSALLQILRAKRSWPEGSTTTFHFETVGAYDGEEQDF